MYLLLGSPKNILKFKQSATNMEPSSFRNKVPIAIIDDQDFPYNDLLRDHQYNLKHFTDIEDIRVVEAFHIVLCDIKGIGKTFKSKFEGAHVISEIRKYYPHKVIFAYTAHQFDASYNKYFNLADAIIKKDTTLEDWIENLDHAIKMVSDPSFIWFRIRDVLFQNDVPIVEIMKLEDQFVGFVEQERTEFPSKKLSTNLPDNIIPLLKSVVDVVTLVRGFIGK